MAYNMGLGVCWAGYFGRAALTYAPLIKALAIPEGSKCYGAMLVGYPKYKYLRVPAFKEPPITWIEQNKH
jgi:hypothetical protein